MSSQVFSSNTRLQALELSPLCQLLGEPSPVPSSEEKSSSEPSPVPSSEEKSSSEVEQLNLYLHVKNLSWDKNTKPILQKVNKRMLLIKKIQSFGASLEELVHLWIVYYSDSAGTVGGGAVQLYHGTEQN